jgi:para-aminobenzoate synthetase component I
MYPIIGIEKLQELKQKAAYWAYNYNNAIILDSNACAHAFGLNKYELIIAAEPLHHITPTQACFAALKDFYHIHQHQWMFGYFGYDLKNEIERLTSQHPDGIGFSLLHFWVPKYVVAITKNLEVVQGFDLIEQICNQNIETENEPIECVFSPKVLQEEYVDTVEKIKEHIVQGDVYELNYCTEFYAHLPQLNTPYIYHKLTQKSPVPFGVYLRHNNNTLMGASPERFLCKRGEKLFSQPIKGTAKRSANEQEDLNLKDELLASEKERAENLMIVDLVRNDLAKSSKTATVEVNELFGIYSFAQVHQMISTVSSVIKPEVHVVDAIKNAFPMGSMTGAPKIMAMQLIEEYEQTKRGLYSGAIGYFSPDGDFDFNVVIRSLQYNSSNGYLNFEVGSAITYDSNPQDEYDECLLKAKAMMEVLGRGNAGVTS